MRLNNELSIRHTIFFLLSYSTLKLRSTQLIPRHLSLVLRIYHILFRVNPLYAIKNKTDFAKVFGSLSSGHKVALKIVTELTAHIAGFTPTLVLIDEPETHLHPPLLAAFLRSVRNCLDAFDAYAIIATHSPVVLQETPAKCVRVLRRTGNENFVSTPLNETFAESIGVITKETFNLGEQATDWHETLKPLAKKYSLEEIEEFFERKLGFAARSYIISVRDEMQE